MPKANLSVLRPCGRTALPSPPPVAPTSHPMPLKPSLLRRPLTWLLFVAAAVGAVAWQSAPREAAPVVESVWPAPSLAVKAESTRFTVMAQGHVPMPANTPAAHASSLVAMPADSPAAMLAFWFAGQRESAPDVQIAYAWFSRTSQQWQAARFVVNKDVMGAALGFGIRRLGNPVGWRDADGRIHLFVVATGLGGWAAGRVLHLQQKGPVSATAASLDAMNFEAVRVLPLSWLWNTSHLVRNAPLPLADGGMVLPLYFELGIKYPVAARFGPTGEFTGLTRLSTRGHVLQPALAMQSGTRWLALLRNHGADPHIAAVGTNDAGQTWHDLPHLNLPNPDAAVAALGLSPQLMVMAYNPSTRGRQRLDLSASANGTDWTTVLALASGDEHSEFSYPALAWGDDSLWVSYTDQRQRIAWKRLKLKP